MELMPDAAVVEWVKDKYALLRPALTERSRRLWAATEAPSLGHGGVVAAMGATGMSSATIYRGLRELDAGRSGRGELPFERIRRPGGRRKRAWEKQPGLTEALKRLVDRTTRGDAESPLRWTCKSTLHLANELRHQGFQVGARTVTKKLAEQRFKLQANRKTRGGKQHPDPNVSPSID